MPRQLYTAVQVSQAARDYIRKFGWADREISIGNINGPAPDGKGKNWWGVEAYIGVEAFVSTGSYVGLLMNKEDSEDVIIIHGTLERRTPS